MHAAAAGDHCKPKTDSKGNKLTWGNVEYDKLYGPQGWCAAETPNELNR
jgi:hypothetical protein